MRRAGTETENSDGDNPEGGCDAAVGGTGVRESQRLRTALEDEPKLDKLDLSLLSEVKRNDKGTVEIKLIDRLQALEQLATVADGERTDMDDFLKALQGGGEE